MPIYAYRCASCGFAKDHLQKLSDQPLDNCPQCGRASYVKQLTAAGFQLKGSGWYATDFKGGNSQRPSANEGAPAAASVPPGEGASGAESAPSSSGANGASACAGN
ncbi:MAG: zinc ribbon domain-containing protein [Candidatus Accumulibacter sp.]|jgi:putative FmdB family regulatory protein|uniref:FmdB family zinc ribbon protein n=1 Tax=Accumulibacter sp. TaxID=2053492 RepID=UPI001A4AD63A|nr:FmdB family zinc ribbon protein [Accumulibacter sp.]MBL8393779.1 zinc ribbon domain-containing protein [Accumulibacter sp.]